MAATSACCRSHRCAARSRWCRRIRSCSPTSSGATSPTTIRCAAADEIWEAAEAADLEDTIQRFPDHLRTLVGERGVTLSGGQKQRTSLARGLIRDTPVLLLDDCFSSVDTETEEHILVAAEGAARRADDHAGVASRIHRTSRRPHRGAGCRQDRRTRHPCRTDGDGGIYAQLRPGAGPARGTGA